MLSKDIEVANGGAGVYQPDYKQSYLLDDDEWKHDIIPELQDGRNVYDFFDADISAKLMALEEEEERLEQEGFYDEENEDLNEQEMDIHEKAEWIRNKHKLMRNAARSKKTIKNRTGIIPRKMQKKTLGQLEQHLSDIGVDSSAISERARSFSRKSDLSSSSGVDIVMDHGDGEKQRCK